jgi:hypothetical protein
MKPWQRVLHGVAAAAFAFLAGLVVFAVAVAFLLRAKGYNFPASSVPGTILEDALNSVSIGQVATTVFALQVIAAMLCIWKRTSYVVILPGLILCGGMVAYLVHDDPQRPLLPDLGPVASTDSEGYKTYCWMVKDSPYSRVDKVQIEPWAGVLFEKKKEKWREYATANQEAIEQAWKNDQIGRDWIDALNQHPPAGIIWSGEGKALGFSALRAIDRHRLNYAICLAAEGHGDEAIRLLIPFIRASFTLQRSGVALLDEMIPVVFLNASYEVAGFILDNGKVSETAKKELATALQDPPPMELILHNAIMGEALPLRDTIDSFGKSLVILHGDFTHEDAAHENPSFTRFLPGLIYNPHLTERHCLEYYQEYFALLKVRDSEKIKRLDKLEETELHRFTLKNPAGSMLEEMIIPVFEGKLFWKADEARLALLKRLGAQ